MISLTTARKLKDSGLVWIPALHDFFAIPERGMDERVFVISDIQAYVEFKNALPMVTFHGASEWALDYLLTSEVIWLPREDQLRMEVVRQLAKAGEAWLNLSNTRSGYRLDLQFMGETLSFQAPEASETYAAALYFLLNA